MRKFFLTGLLLLTLITGCGAVSKQTILDKAKNARNKAELEKALGRPDNFTSAEVPFMGSAETWEYKASDGKVIFQIIGDKVVLKAAE